MNLIQYENIPLELRQTQRWILWKLEKREGQTKPTKIPYQSNRQKADSTNHTTWTTFDKIWESYDTDSDEFFSGVGCVIAAPYVGVDLDGCRNPKTGEVKAWAQEIVTALDSYAESSVSGTGIHIWVKAAMPEGGNRKGQVEIYGTGRYFTMSGQHLAGTPQVINERQDALNKIHKKHILNNSTSVLKDDSPSAKEFKLLCDLWKESGENATEEEITLSFFQNAEYREKWEKNRQYISRSVRAAKMKVFPREEEPKNLKISLQTKRMSEFELERMEWLWNNRIAKGKLAVFSGNPGCGKTFVICDIISRLTTGRDWPDESPNINEAMEVLIFNDEDGAKDTLRPRFDVAGADCSKIHYAQGMKIQQNAKSTTRMVTFDSDLAAIETYLEHNPSIHLVVIDPLSNYLGQADMNKEQKLREVLTPIAKLANEKNITFIIVGHFNKRNDVSAIHRLGGAVAFSGVARTVLGFMENPEKKNEFYMMLAKTNFKRALAMKYELVESEIGDESTAKVNWLGQSDANIDDIADIAKDPEKRITARAERFLKEIRVPMPTGDINRTANALGLSSRAVERARKELCMVTEKRGKVWYCLPLQAEENSVSDNLTSFATLYDGGVGGVDEKEVQVVDF